MRGCYFKRKKPLLWEWLIHNGLFDGGLVEGDGIAAKLLKQEGIRVLGESEITEDFSL